MEKYNVTAVDVQGLTAHELPRCTRMMDFFKTCFFMLKEDLSTNDEEHVRDAISGALSSLDDSQIRINYLHYIMKTFPFYVEVATKMADERRLYGRTITTTDEENVENTTQKPSKAFLTLAEVCELFKLPKSKVKDKRWRDAKGFPYNQIADKGKVIYKRADVEEWINRHQSV